MPRLPTMRRPRAADGLPSAPSRNDDVLLSERAARTMIGGVSHMFIRRQLATDAAFPKLVRVGRRRFYWRNDILKWLGSPAAAQPDQPPPAPSRRAG